MNPPEDFGAFSGNAVPDLTTFAGALRLLQSWDAGYGGILTSDFRIASKTVINELQQVLRQQHEENRNG